MIETYPYGTRKDLVSEKEEIKCNNIIMQNMINFDDVTKENMRDNISIWPQIFDHSYRILITGGFGSRKSNLFFHLISHQPDIDKIYLDTKDPYEAKYQFLINKRVKTGLKYFNDSKAFIEYEIYNIYKILIHFDDMIADMLSNRKLNPIVTELFIRGRKLNISLVSVTQSYLAVPKIIMLNSTQYFIMKILNTRELR